MATTAKTVKGKITQLTIHADNWNDMNNPGTGCFCIYMNELPQASPDGYKRVIVTKTHPAFSEIVQVALSAQSRNANVELTYLESHIVRANSWDFGVLSIMY